MGRTDAGTATGIVALTVGTLLLLGWAHIPVLRELVAAVLVLVGVLGRTGHIKMAQAATVLLLAVGIFLFVPSDPSAWVWAKVAQEASLLIGLLLLILGLLLALRR